MSGKDSSWNAVVNFFFEKLLPWALLGGLTFLCGFIWQSNTLQTQISLKLENIIKNEVRIEAKVDRIDNSVNQLKLDVAVLKK